MKKVSVIIPTYKRSDYLLRAIDSVINQTYSNIEIIVVDDNDKDTIFRRANEEKLKTYIDRKSIIYLQHEFNRNGAVARNTGLNVATGDYITFLDDDDFFLKNRIELLVNALNMNPQYDCVYSSMIKIKKNHFYNYRIAKKNGNLLKDVLCQYSFFGTGSNMFFTRKCIDVIGNFDEKFFRFQDLEYMARFFENGFKIYSLNKVLVVKCEEDNINLPNFNRLKQAKEMYIEKFRKSILKFKNDYNSILYSIYKELYIFSEKNDHKIAINELSKYGKIKLKDKIIYIYNFLSNKFKICNAIDLFIRNFRCYGKYTKNEKNEIMNILKKYGE